MNITPVDALIACETGLGKRLSRTLLTTWQFSRLRKTLLHALASPFYRNRFADFSKEQILSISTPEDFARLPLMTSLDLRGEGLRLLACSQSEVARLVSLQTSGSTGPPKRIGFTEEELAATGRFFAQGMKSLLTDREKVLVVFPAHLPYSVGSLLQQVLPQAGHPVIIHWPPGNEDALAAAAIAAKAQSVIGLPSHLLALAEHLGKHHSVRTMLLCADYAPPVLRKRIEATGITTFLHYGSTESGFGGAVECQAHDGCHLWESELFMEVIDPETEKPLPEGEFGELVLTTLQRRAMPLIRLRTGDFGRISKKQCRCGGISARIDETGRQQILKVKGGEVRSRELDALFFSIPGLFDYRAKMTDNGLELSYLATRDIRQNTFPELPAGLKYAKIKRLSDPAQPHTAKRLLVDGRAGKV